MKIDNAIINVPYIYIYIYTWYIYIYTWYIYIYTCIYIYTMKLKKQNNFNYAMKSH